LVLNAGNVKAILGTYLIQNVCNVIVKNQREALKGIALPSKEQHRLGQT